MSNILLILSQCIVKNVFLSGRVCWSGNPRILAKLYIKSFRSIQSLFTVTSIVLVFEIIPGLGMFTSQLQKKSKNKQTKINKTNPKTYPPPHPTPPKKPNQPNKHPPPPYKKTQIINLVK